MPSIRGRGKDTIHIQKREIRRVNGFQEYVNIGDPIEMRHVSMQSVREWASAEEEYMDGLQLLSLRRMFARSWPGDVHSIVYFEGRQYETVGEPQRMDGSPRTAHWVITLKLVGAQPEGVVLAHTGQEDAP